MSHVYYNFVYIYLHVYFYLDFLHTVHLKKWPLHGFAIISSENMYKTDLYEKLFE